MSLTQNQNILQLLEQRVQELLKSNPQKLVGLLYKLDVDESAWHASRSLSLDKAAKLLAAAIWKRQIKKLTTRNSMEEILGIILPRTDCE